MYILEDNSAKAECVVMGAGKGVLEIKNIAAARQLQGMGYGMTLIEFNKGRYSILEVATGDSPLTIPFYEKCGFIHSIKNFFIDTRFMTGVLCLQI